MSICILIFTYSNPQLLIIYICLSMGFFAGEKITLVFGLQNVLSSLHPAGILIFYSTQILWYIYTGIWRRSGVLLLSYVVSYVLYLGGLWAFQEFTWGGWWNWDIVEVPTLLNEILVIFVLFHIHVSKIKEYRKVMWFITYLYLCLVAVRYSLGSVHSFVVTSILYGVYYTFVLISTPLIVIGLELVMLLAVPKQFTFLKLYMWFLGIHICVVYAQLIVYNWFHGVALYALFLWGCINSQYWNHVIILGRPTSQHVFTGNLFSWIKPTTTVYKASIHHLSTIIN